MPLRGGATEGKAARALAAGAVVAGLVAGCGSSSAKLTGPSLPGAAPEASSSSTVAPSTTTVPPTHHVGDPVTFTGSGGLSVIVQVAGIVDPATAAASYDQPGAGMRYVAVRIAVNDTGPVALTTDLLADTALDEGSGTTVGPIVLDMSNCPVNFGGELAVTPGGPVSVGCISFEIPAAATIGAVHVALAAGPGGQATWTP